MKIFCFLTRRLLFCLTEKPKKNLNEAFIVGTFLMEQLMLFLVQKIDKSRLHLECISFKIRFQIFFLFSSLYKPSFMRICSLNFTNKTSVRTWHVSKRFFISFPAFNFKQTSAISSLWQSFAVANLLLQVLIERFLWIKATVNSR